MFDQDLGDLSNLNNLYFWNFMLEVHLQPKLLASYPALSLLATLDATIFEHLGYANYAEPQLFVPCSAAFTVEGQNIQMKFEYVPPNTSS